MYNHPIRVIAEQSLSRYDDEARRPLVTNFLFGPDGEEGEQLTTGTEDTAMGLNDNLGEQYQAHDEDLEALLQELDDGGATGPAELINDGKDVASLSDADVSAIPHPPPAVDSDDALSTGDNGGDAIRDRRAEAERALSAADELDDDALIVEILESADNLRSELENPTPHELQADQDAISANGGSVDSPVSNEISDHGEKLEIPTTAKQVQKSDEKSTGNRRGHDSGKTKKLTPEMAELLKSKVPYYGKTGSKIKTTSRLPIATAIISVLALGTAVVSGWIVYGKEQQLTALRSQLMHSEVSTSDPDIKRYMDPLYSEIRRMQQQIEVVSNALVELQQSTEQRIESEKTDEQQKIASVVERLQALEQKLSGLPLGSSPIENNKPRSHPASSLSKKNSAQLKPVATTITPSTDTPTSSVADQGGWIISLASLSSLNLAKKELKRFQDYGIQASVQPAMVRGKAWFRLVVTGYPSRAAAKQGVVNIKRRLPQTQPWVIAAPSI